MFAKKGNLFVEKACATTQINSLASTTDQTFLKYAMQVKSFVLIPAMILRPLNASKLLQQLLFFAKLAKIIVVHNATMP
jgi:hypothetical protein